MVVPIREFDMVLGMDWLARYHAVIDCEKRQVHLQEPGCPELVFQACKSTFFTMFISATRARRLIEGGCRAYFASVDLVTRPSPSFTDIPVVREFQDVFTEELPRMPLEREIEFSIDLIPSTLPITKAPYRMAFAELKEVKA